MLATPSGRLECTLLGTACAESDLKIDQVLDLVARLRVLSAKGLCTESKFQAIEFLCHFGFSPLVKFGLRDDSKAALFEAISRWCTETGNEV